MNWQRIFNRLWELINTDGEMYYSGRSFIDAVREVDPYFPNYYRYYEKRKADGLSTSRVDYYWDILMSFNEENRISIINGILDNIHDLQPEKCDAIKAALGGGEDRVPINEIGEEVWNAERLKRLLDNINQAIANAEFERAVTLSYTTLEGFYKAFILLKIPDQAGLNEITQMSKVIKTFLKEDTEQFPNEVFTMFNHVTHTIDRTRNGFGEAHFGNEAGLKLANYMRDLMNSQIRLLLQFM